MSAYDMDRRHVTLDPPNSPRQVAHRAAARRRIAAAGLDPEARDLITRMLGLEDHP